MADDAIHITAAREVDDGLVAAFAHLMPQLDAHIAAPGRAELEAIVASEATTLLVARDGAGQIVGALSLAIYRVPTGTKAWIEDVIVDARARGRGLGEKLSRAALAEARALGASSVSLTSRPERAAANRLYQRIGFERRETNLYRYALED
ncbi:MAG: GNAT family N-acetyltransferase [Myxococcales bacterium]|nr:GNAT family N-acetyltransferase [Myxococcales bacterium]